MGLVTVLVECDCCNEGEERGSGEEGWSRSVGQQQRKGR